MDIHKSNKTWKLKVLVILTIAITVSLGFYMYQGNEVNVTLQQEDEVKEITSTANTVEELLEKEGIPFEEGAYINIPLDTKLEENMNIIIKHPKTYTVLSGELEIDIKSIHVKVKDILRDNHIVLGDKDYTYPLLEEEISPGSFIELFKVEEVLETVEDLVPFENIVRNSNRLDVGVTKVIQEGKDGLKNIYIKKEYVNGELDSTEVVNEEMVVEPVPHIVEKGTKAIVMTSRGNTSYRKAITMTATAYDLSFESTGKRPGDKWYGITASGTKARPGVVAVDPRVIPLGTKLYVESLDGSKDYGFAVAEDTGGAIKGNKIDLFFETASEVRRFGRRKVKVYIINE